MKIIRTTKLSDQQKEDIRHITEACGKIHPFSLTFPLEEEAIFYLLCDPAPVCALALLLPEDASPDSAAECVAFTLPSRQRQGCFFALFEKAVKEVEERDLFFLTDGSDKGARKTLAALGAEFDCSEYRMDLNLTEMPFPARKPEASRLTVFPDASGENLTLAFRLNTADNSPAGVCHFALFEKSACLYGFEISENLRGRGLGTEALLLSLAYVKNLRAETVFLQVSGHNAAAIRLYKKTGFRISETLSYYLY